MSNGNGNGSGPVAAEAQPSLAALVREDFATHNHDVTSAGFQALLVHRIGAWRRSQPRWVKVLLDLVYKPAFVFVRNVYGIELYDTATVGRRVKIAHQSGIVLHPFIEIGDDSTIRQNVSVASTGGTGGPATERPPRLGRRVSIGAGAVVFGGVSIGDDVKVGPNVVVTTNVPAGSMVFANPPRVLTRPGAATPGAPEPTTEVRRDG